MIVNLPQQGRGGMVEKWVTVAKDHMLPTTCLVKHVTIRHVKGSQLLFFSFSCLSTSLFIPLFMTLFGPFYPPI